MGAHEKAHKDACAARIIFFHPVLSFAPDFLTFSMHSTGVPGTVVL